MMSDKTKTTPSTAALKSVAPASSGQWRYVDGIRSMFRDQRGVIVEKPVWFTPLGAFSHIPDSFTYRTRNKLQKVIEVKAEPPTQEQFKRLYDGWPSFAKYIQPPAGYQAEWEKANN